jgi:hypothetical protein
VPVQLLIDGLKMRIGTAEIHSTFAHQGLAIKKIILANGYSSSVELLPTKHSSTENINKLVQGDIDFGFIASNWVGKAVRGVSPFAGPADISIVAPLNIGPMYFITLSQSKIKSIQDLRGKRVAVGAAHSGTCQHAISILDALSLSFDDIEPVFLGFRAGAEALTTGSVDVQLQCPYPNEVMTFLDKNYDIKVVELTSDDLDKITKKYSIYRSTIMPKGSLRALNRDSLQPAVFNVIITHSRTKAHLIESIITHILNNQLELANSNPLFNCLPTLFNELRLNSISALEYDGCYLHPLAKDLYLQKGFKL